jgi:citrate synthase
MPKEVLSILDQRSHATYEIPIQNGTIRAMDLRQIQSGQAISAS